MYIDEVAGVSRHLRQLRSLTTGDLISRTISPEASARLTMATDILCDVLGGLAGEHYQELLDWKLPEKWGEANRASWYERVVAFAATPVKPLLTGFVKLRELALPLNKLPRLVGSMGKLSCAKDSAAICCVETLVKRYLPHLGTKGMSADALNNRFASFAARS